MAETLGYNPALFGNYPKPGHEGVGMSAEENKLPSQEVAAAGREVAGGSALCEPTDFSPSNQKEVVAWAMASYTEALGEEGARIRNTPLISEGEIKQAVREIETGRRASLKKVFGNLHPDS
jgi:hypothetical protein